MLSQYTWGQFLLFSALLVVVYYLGVGLLYYRDELTGLLRGRRPGRQATLAAANPPSALVRTASAFAPPAPAAAPAPENPTSGAADNLPEPAAPLVTGALPDTNGARGQDAGPAAEAPMAAEVASAAEQEQHLDEGRADEQPDEADQTLAALIRQVAATGPAQATPLAAEAAAIPKTSSEENAAVEQSGFIDKSNNKSLFIETKLSDSGVEGETVYKPTAGADLDPLAVFDEQLASPLDLLPAAPEPLVEADSLAAFLAGVQQGAQPAVPAELLGTSLAAQMADLTRQNQQELLALFGQEA